MVWTEDDMTHMLRGMNDQIACPTCKTRLRYGDYECPRCGEDIEEQLRAWATAILEHIRP